MGRISADTLRRLYLLNVIATFPRGSYGLLRLQKVAYIAQRGGKQPKPFKYKKYHLGQYSEELDAVKDQLCSMGYVAALPLDTATSLKLKLSDGSVVELWTGGNRLVIADSEIMNLYRFALAQVYPSLPESIGSAVEEYGLLKEAELIAKCYAFPEVQRTEFDKVIVESDLPAWIEAKELSEDDCEELELSLNPNFVCAMGKIVEGMERSAIRLDRIEMVAKTL